MNKLLLLVTFIIRVGSGIVMLMQGYEKLTGGIYAERFSTSHR